MGKPGSARFSWLTCVICTVFLYSFPVTHTVKQDDSCKAHIMTPECQSECYNPCYFTGQELTITCEVRSCHRCSQDIKIIHWSQGAIANTMQPLRVGNTSSSSQIYTITLHSIDRQDEGTYTCSAEGCFNDSLLNVAHVSIGGKPSKPSEFACISQNFWNMTCSWRSRDSVSTNWTVLYTVEYNSSIEPSDWKSLSCSNLTERSDDYITCTLNEDNFIQYVTYKIQLVASNCAGTSTFSYNITATESIVKLNPVSDISETHIHSRNLTLNWRIDYSPNALNGVWCNISEQSEWGKNRILNFYTNDLDFRVNFLISGLEPNTRYHYSIICVPHHSRYWSDVRSIAVQTAPDVPTELPALVEWSYRDTSLGRRIYLYMIPLPKQKWHADSLSLLLQTYSGLQKVPHPQTAPGNSSTTTLNQTFRPEQDYNITLRLQNEIGCSNDSKIIHVPSNTSNECIQAHDIIVERISELSYKISVLHAERFLLNENISLVYMYYQCLGLATVERYPPLCLSDFRPVTSRISNDSVRVTVNKSPDVFKWYFGVEIQTVGFQNSLTWSTCYFYPDKASMTPRIDVQSTGDNMAIIKLLFRFCELPERPLKYQYSLVTSKDCLTTGGVNITASPDVRLIPVDVEPAAHYKVCFRIYSEKTMTTISTTFVTESKLSGSETNVPLVVGVAFGVIVAIVTIMVIRVCYKKMNVKIPIQVPQIQTQEIHSIQRSVFSNSHRGYEQLQDPAETVISTEHSGEGSSLSTISESTVTSQTGHLEQLNSGYHTVSSTTEMEALDPQCHEAQSLVSQQQICGMPSLDVQDGILSETENSECISYVYCSERNILPELKVEDPLTGGPVQEIPSDQTQTVKFTEYKDTKISEEHKIENIQMTELQQKVGSLTYCQPELMLGTTQGSPSQPRDAAAISPGTGTNFTPWRNECHTANDTPSTAEAPISNACTEATTVIINDSKNEPRSPMPNYVPATQAQCHISGNHARDEMSDSDANDDQMDAMPEYCVGKPTEEYNSDVFGVGAGT